MTVNEPEKNRTNIGGQALSWWEKLQPPENGRKGGNPGALARLRRADLFDASMEEVTFELYRSIAPLVNMRREIVFERTTLIAAVLAQVRDDEDRKSASTFRKMPVAEAAGQKRKGSDDQHVVHPLRLRRLLATHSPQDCLIAFRRLVALLGKTANVADLAESLLDWPDELRGETRRTRWAFDYYGAGSAAPDDDNQAAA